MSESILSKRWPWILIAFIVLGVYASTFVEIRIPNDSPYYEYPDRRPIGDLDDIREFAERTDTNVLFLLIDTLRAHRMGMYGYERDTTPFLDRIADSGVLFKKNLAQSSWTKCSMASLWLGLYPPRAGITRFNQSIPPEAMMPAEIFQEAGFQTVGVYRNGWVSGYFGFDQGFDVYAKPSPRPVPASVRRMNPTLTQHGTDIDNLETGAEFLRLHGDDRWLLYLHLMDVHEFVYDAESALFGTSNSDLYDNAVRHEDWVVQQIFEELDRLGQRERTLVVIASDHGEAFGERGSEGHARDVHRETTEVPLILSFPFRLEPGIQLTHRTANIDVWPTVFDLMGLGPLENQDGQSRREEILAGGNSGEDSERSFAYLDQSWGNEGRPRPSVSITQGSLRYVIGNDRGRWLEWLFDSESDPTEMTNLIDEDPERSERFKKAAVEHGKLPAVWKDGAPELEIDEMELNQLRALGYAIP